MDAQHWENMYRSRAKVFSGAPNPALVSEIDGLTPGRALDVGCGEGADAIWLAQRGWQVTGVDTSATALERAAAAAAASDVQARVSWTQAHLTVTPFPADTFDLVSLHYFPLRRQPDHTTLHGLLDAVAPGGTLLFVTHARTGLAASVDFDPDDYYQPGDIAPLLAASWNVLVNETRLRTGPAPADTRHTHDTVLRAVRQRGAPQGVKPL